MRTLFTLGYSLLLLLSSGCGKDSTGIDAGYGPVYLNMTINGDLALDLTAESPMDQSAMLTARVTTQDMPESDGALKKNTLIIGASEIIDQAESKVKSLSISMPNMTQTGTYDLVDQGGIFVFSDSSEGMSALKGYTIAEPGDGTCTVTITEIGGEPIATAGKVVKGTFTASLEDAGIVYTIKGSFNGGLPE